MNTFRFVYLSLGLIAAGLSGCSMGEGSNATGDATIKALNDLEDNTPPESSTEETPVNAASGDDADKASTTADTGEPAAKTTHGGTAIATFGNGCYWCTEAVFQEFKGIESVVSGFSGGKSENVTYEEVCTGTTGHAEVVQIRYDPAQVSYEELLQVFFLTHDPTTLNRQGADIGTQYRSVIFYHDDAQKRLAEKAIQELTEAKAFRDPIVTEVSAYTNFINAGEKHQDYFDKNPTDRYCLYNIPSKVKKIRKVFRDKVKDK